MRHDKINLSDNVKNYRLKYGYSQSTLGKLSGVSKAAISKIEIGCANPRLSTLIGLSNAFNIKFNQLIMGIKNEY